MTAEGNADATESSYAEEPSPQWTSVTQSTEADGSVVLSGVCARCTHPTTYVSRDVWVDGTAAVKTADDAAAVEVVVRCDCGRPHEGRDADGIGCGAYWFYPEPQAGAR